VKIYTFSSGFYRFFSGVVLLLVNWHIASSNGGGYDMLAISTTLSFIPAVFVPPLIRFSPITGGARMTAVGLVGVSLILALIGMFYTSIKAVVALNFVLWIFFFFLESTWEIWFNNEASGLDGARTRQYSSLTMTVNQVALMVGPLFAPLFTRMIQANWVLIACATLFGVIAGLNLKPRMAVEPVQQFGNEGVNVARKSVSRFYLFSFMLIWPILGTFNFMLPLQALAHGKSMLTVGVLDALLGVGMAVAGILMNRLTKQLRPNWIMVSSALGVAVAILVWICIPIFGVPQMVAVFGLGCAFGFARILLRAEATAALSARRVGSIVANANAYSLLLLTAVLGGGRYFSAEIWLAPFVLTLMLILIFSKIRTVPGNSLTEVPAC
jgi:MFS family permease